MWTDAVELRDFYASPLGGVANRMIGRCIRDFWPTVRGGRVLGLGYATPYLDTFRPEADRVIAAMPAAQGVLHWPANGARSFPCRLRSLRPVCVRPPPCACPHCS